MDFLQDRHSLLPYSNSEGAADSLGESVEEGSVSWLIAFRGLF